MRRKDGSRTFCAALPGEYQPIRRWCFSGHFLCSRTTRNANTRTTHRILVPFFKSLSYEYAPIGRLVTFPATPPSSNASAAAVSWGGIPLLGHPLGMIQRRVPREVTSITCNSDLVLSLYGS